MSENGEKSWPVFTLLNYNSNQIISYQSSCQLIDESLQLYFFVCLNTWISSTCSKTSYYYIYLELNTKFSCYQITATKHFYVAFVFQLRPVHLKLELQQLVDKQLFW